MCSENAGNSIKTNHLDKLDKVKSNREFISKKVIGNIDYLLVILAALFFLNLYGTFQFVGLLLGGYVFLKYSKIVLFPDKIQILLLLFGFTYVVFSSFNIDFSFRTVYAFIFLPWLAFTAGKVNALNLKNEKKLIALLLVFSASVAFIYIFSVVDSFIQTGFAGTRVADLRFLDRTGDTIERSATGVGMHIVPLLAFLPVLLFANNGIGKKALIVGSVLSILAAFTSTLLLTRTPIGLLGLLFIFVFFYNLRSQLIKNKIIIILIFSATIYAFQSVDFQAIEITAGLYGRFHQEDVGDFGFRLEMWREGARNIFLYPLGGETLRYDYYHNLWLDLRKFGGIIPMVLLIAFSVFSVKAVYQVLRNAQLSLQTRSLIGSMFFVVFAMMFMEPVIEGSPVFFLFYVFLVGLLRQFNISFQKRVQHKTLYAQ